MKYTPPINTSTLLLLASFVSHHLMAEVFFNYENSNDYVSVNESFDTLAVPSIASTGTYRFKRSFSDSAALSPSTANYIGPTFYGGYQFSSSTINGGLNRQEIRDNFGPSPNGDQIYLQAYRLGGWSGSVLSMHGCYVFKQDDFKSGYQQKVLSLDLLNVEWSGYGNADSSGASYNAIGRYLIKQDGNYYLSESTFSITSNGSHSLTAVDISTERWAIYNPTSSLNFDQGSAAYINFIPEDLTAVGVYFEDDFWTGTSGSNSAFGFGLRSFSANDNSWRSSLYGDSWTAEPALTFENDKILQDFSYAGYRNGLEDIPLSPSGLVVNVVTDYGADPTGVADSTSAIQNAINSIPPSGGVVYLPQGTYSVSPQAGKAYCLKILKSHVVLRGDGPEDTYILNQSVNMRNKVIIYAFSLSAARWKNIESPLTMIAEDLPGPTTEIPVDDATLFNVGDQIIIRMDPSLAWLEEHHETADWSSYMDEIGSIMYLRTIQQITGNTLLIDRPTRYYLKLRDSPYVYKKTGLIEEVGIEDLSIGNVESSGDGWGTMDFADANTSGYEAHGSYAITLLGVVNSWVKNVNSFRAPGNITEAHILSNGIRIRESSAVTVQNCHFRNPQYGGGGGNGYLFRIGNSNECLLDFCSAEYSRHGFSITGMSASGNVLLECLDVSTGHQIGGPSPNDNVTTGKGSDHHSWLSHSNLHDNCIADQSWFEARDRWYENLSAPKHNSTSAHSVYWNTECRDNTYSNISVWSQQVHYGYVIGTRGNKPNVRVNGDNPKREYIFLPEDHVEGVGEGTRLFPTSLYLDQLTRRISN